MGCLEMAEMDNFNPQDCSFPSVISSKCQKHRGLRNKAWMPPRAHRWQQGPRTHSKSAPLWLVCKDEAVGAAGRIGRPWTMAQEAFFSEAS